MSDNIYESPQLLAEYLLFHYGSAEEVLGGIPGPGEAVGFATRLVRKLLAPDTTGRALDLGCAVGASSFELARSCTEVIGVDFSHTFIIAAQTLAETGHHPFEKLTEGTIKEPSVAHVPTDVDRARTHFQQGDAQNLPADLGTFDVVLAANLLCRLPDPMQLIRRLPSLVQSGGQLLLTTPFTWLADFTAKENWIGGTPATSRSFDALRTLLESHFELEFTADIPFLLREHSRKFQYSVACGSHWRRR